MDFGEVPVGEWRTQSVLLRNTGYVAFRVGGLTPVNGNPAFLLELEPGMMQPGESRPITVGLQVFTGTDQGIDWSLICAATLLAVAPLLIAFLLFQRQFVQSFMRAGIR